MNFKELYEGVAPKLPGAFNGVQVMTPQQFVAKAGDEKEVDENALYGDEEVSWEKGGRRAPTGAFRNPTVDQHGSQDNGEDSEDEDHLSRIRKLSGLDEATELPAPQRELGGDEFQDYMKRIVGTPDIDPKTGQVKVGKDIVSKKTGEVTPGAEKYISGKTKGDKYKMPYIHRSSVITYLSPDGKTYNEDAVKQTLKQRPKALLKQNENVARHKAGSF